MAKVLICDDYEPLRKSLATLVELDHHEVLEAAEGAEALRLLATEAVDLLLLDMHMPGVGGDEVLRTLDCPPPTVIVVSAFEYASRRATEDEFGSKVAGFIQKPVEPDMLREALAAALPPE